MTRWKEVNGQLHRSFEFKNFVDAWAFMNKVALLAEKNNHHPMWENVYNKVDIRLSTHDEGNIITSKDRMMAQEIDKLL